MTGPSDRDRARSLLAETAVPKIEIPRSAERTRRQFKLPEELNTPIPERMPRPEGRLDQPGAPASAPETEDRVPALASPSRPTWPWIVAGIVLVAVAAGVVLTRLL